MTAFLWAFDTRGDKVRAWEANRFVPMRSFEEALDQLLSHFEGAPVESPSPEEFFKQVKSALVSGQG